MGHITVNRRNFLKTTSAIVAGTILLPSIGVSNTFNNKSKFIWDGDHLIIIPSQHLIKKYDLCLTSIPSFITIDNEGAAVKTQMTPFGGVQELNTPLNKSLYCNEKFVESIVKHAKEKMGMKTIYVIIVTRALCLQGVENCLCCSRIRIMVRHSRKELNMQFA